MTAVALLTLAIAAVVVVLVRGRPRDGARAGFVSPEEGSPPPAVDVGGTPGENTLTRHLRQSLEALDRHAGGQPLCRVGAATSGGLKQAEGAVAALTDVARRHRTQPEEGLSASAAHVLQAWRAELTERDGPHWQAYRAGGEQAIWDLTTDIASLESHRRL